MDTFDIFYMGLTYSFFRDTSRIHWSTNLAFEFSPYVMLGGYASKCLQVCTCVLLVGGITLNMIMLSYSKTNNASFSESETIIKEQMVRHRIIEKICTNADKTITNKGRNTVGVSSVLLVDEVHDVAYCAIPKGTMTYYDKNIFLCLNEAQHM